MRTSNLRALAALAPFLLAACGEDTPSQPGADGFFSADPGTGPSGRFGAPTAGEDNSGGEEPPTTTVEEGDIYRLLPGGLIADLNPYRGLLIVDVSDPSAPVVKGRAPLSASPVEMYVVGSHAYALVNGWRGYWGGREDVALETYEGGLVVSFDLSDPENPTIQDTARVPGWIGTSRLVRQGDAAALYVVSSEWNYEAHGDAVGVSQASTLVRSFSLGAGGELTAKGSVDLGGWVQAVQGTPQALLVAHQSENWSGPTLVKVVTIDAAGLASPGPEVEVKGWVRSKTALDMVGDIVRVASSDGTRAHLQTFKVDGATATPVDDVPFGNNEDLYASIFLGERAFFVTYRRIDPFHAFSIDADGNATEHSAFEVSGWNDFFKPAFGGTRLIGVGVDDTSGWNLAASLWEIEDLENPQPLLARATVTDSYGWSEAQWDDRAFTVLEGAVSVQQGDVTETGLVLLPYSGYDPNTGSYGSGVQLFTFSKDTLTRRGLLATDVPVRRGISTQEEVAGALTDSDLSLYDVQDPSAPALLGRVELAPNFADFEVAGGKGVRLRSPDSWYGWWGGQATGRAAQLEVIELGGDPDAAAPLATFEVPATAQLFTVGDTVVSVAMEYVSDSDPGRWSTTVDVFDLSGAPERRGHLVTDELTPSWGGYGYYPAVDDCFDCGRGYYWGGSTEAHAVGDALVFPSYEWRQEVVGTTMQCWDQGGVSCSSDGECREIPGERTCQPVPRYFYWRVLTLDVLDVSDPSEPALRDAIVLDGDEDADRLLASGSTLHESYRVPFNIPGDPRPYVRWYVRAIDLSDPADPVVGEGVNVPGAVIAASGDDYLTRDETWSETSVETSVARVRIQGGKARLLARQRFADTWVAEVVPGGAGHVLVSHRDVNPTRSWNEVKQQLTVLDAISLAAVSTTDVDSWASLQAAIAGRALFSVPGGMLVMNLDDAALPYAQAYFPMIGWPMGVEQQGRDVYFAAGRFGVVRFDLDEVNLPLK